MRPQLLFKERLKGWLPLTLILVLTLAWGWIAFFPKGDEINPALLVSHANPKGATPFSIVPGLVDTGAEAELANRPMTIASRFTVLDSAEHPAAGAVVTLADQQRFTDENGVVYFDHLMLHVNDHITIYYNGEHYDKAFHQHNLNTITLGWSNELRHNLLLGLGIALALTLFLTLFSYIRTYYRRTSRLPGFKANWRVIASASLVVLLLIQGIVAASFWLAPLSTASAAISDSLPVPNNIQVEQDDNNAIVNWNGGPLLPGDIEPAPVMGYRLSWGVAGQTLGNSLTTEYRVAQLQPLVNGQAYQLQIQSVDSKGNVSKPSVTVNFTGDPTRVNKLRSQMTGFFDDFNRSAGSVDELKWNAAYSACNDPSLSYFFVNTQYHSHNMISDAYCDRGQSISRTRQMFDFSNRTGTITFDFDGSFRRDVWYLDFVPALTDITGQVNLDNPDVPAAPGNMLRLQQNEQGLAIIWVDANGTSQTISETNWNPYIPLDWQGLRLVSNVRRHWTMKVSQSKIEMLVNGKTVLVGNVNLPFNKAYLLWNQFSYNTHKSNQAYNMIHWDNFGFDGPKSNTATYNYPIRANGGSGDRFSTDKTFSTSLTIPDDINGQQTAERLMFTLQPDNWNSWDTANNVVVNGKKLTVTTPKSGNLSYDQIIGPITPYSVVLNLTKGTLQKGANSLQFNLSSMTVLNLHAEIDYPSGNAPAYTQPNLVSVTGNGTPTMTDVGPSARMIKLGTTELNITSDNRPTVNASGSIDLQVEIDNVSALQATGKNTGISRVELWLDKKVIYREDVDKAPAYKGVIKLNTTQFSNGSHELHLQAYNANGTPSLPDYFQASALSGDYYPLTIKVSNANPGPTATALPATAVATTVGATKTATAVPATSTPKPVNTATAVPVTNTPTVAPTKTTTPPVSGSPFKSYLTLGVAGYNNDWFAASGVPYTFRYQYLAGDVLGSSWKDWNSPDGQFATNFMTDTKNLGAIPVFTYYLIVQSAPGNAQGEVNGTFANLNDANTMKAYFTNFRLLMQKAAEYGQPVIVHVEPDFWGFMQQRNANPTAITAKVATSGFGDVATGKPNNVAGFAQTLVALRDKYAPNVTLGYHMSGWASGTDVNTNTDPNLNLDTIATSMANFYKGLGANFDVMFWDTSDRDAGYTQAVYGDGGVRFWDVANVNFPNFKRHASLLAKVNQQTGKKNVLWQTPYGNSKQPNNTNHWKDNRVEYFLGAVGAGYVNNLKDYISAGVVAIMFGAGAGDQTSESTDGDLFKTLSKAYYNTGGLPLNGANPPATTTPTIAPATATAVPATATAKPTTAPGTTATAVPATPTTAPPATATTVPATATAKPTTAPGTTAPPVTATPTKVPATATPTQAAATNLVLNPGWENGSNDWFLQSPPFSVANGNAKSGNKSLKLTSNNPQWENAAQSFDVQPNKTYTLTFWAKGAKTPFVDILDTGWGMLYRVQVNATSGYTKYSLTFNSGNRNQLVLAIRDIGGTGNTFFDDFEIKSV